MRDENEQSKQNFSGSGKQRVPRRPLQEGPGRAKRKKTHEVSELTVDPIKRIFVSLSTYRITRARLTSAYRFSTAGAAKRWAFRGTAGSESWTFWLKIGRNLSFTGVDDPCQL